jgi:digeranylgeranylglycerophospholipid reductase
VASSGGPPGYEFLVIGAGPAGVAAAYAIARRGYKVVVAEASPRPALKPCGWGIPEAPGIPFEIPREAVIARVNGMRMHIDGEEALEVRGWVRGYIVDKPSFIEAVASDAGAEILYRAPYLPGRRIVRLPGIGVVGVDGERALLAGGHPFYAGETIMAVEYEARLPEGCLEEDMLYIDFDTRLIGYYWAFPRGGGLFQLGVGGYASVGELVGLLERWASRLPCRATPRTRPRGARLAVGGLRLGRVDGIPLAGEAAGFVLPLTGEGIRPSIASGYAAGDALARGLDPLRSQERIPLARAVKVQRLILERVKAMKPARRAELLKSIPARVHAEVALGTLRASVIAAELASKPRLASRLLRIVLKK